MKAPGFYAVAAFLLLWTVPAFSQHMHGEKVKTESAVDASTVRKEVYSCPMHPEVVSAKPGKCPKCKMKLKKILGESRDSTHATPIGMAAPSDDQAMMEGKGDVASAPDSIERGLVTVPAQNADSDCCASNQAKATGKTKPSSEARGSGRPSCCGGKLEMKKNDETSR